MIQETIPLTGVHHIGVVVRDVEKTVEFYEKNYSCVFQTPPETGTERIHIIRHKGALFRGKPVDYAIKSAFTKLGPIYLEFIQPLEGQELRTEFLEKHGEGMQHVGIRVDDLEAELAKMQRLGFEVVLRSEPGFRSTWAYLDTNKAGGVMYELVQRRKPQ